MIGLGPDFRGLSTLGQGSFATVYEVEHIPTGAVYAAKQPTKRYATFEAVAQLPEVLSLRALQGHPHVISLHDVLFDAASGCASLLLEVLDRNLLEILTARQRPFDEITALLFAHQILTAVAFMHARGIFHRDLKPENCMVDTESLVLKLVDFGSVRGPWSPARMTEYCSTRWYRAPEFVLTAGAYGAAVDEWAVGCMLYEMLTSKPLFPGKNELDQIGRIHNLLGTPSRELIQQFKQNPNHQIQFKFVQRIGQDLQKWVPRASLWTIELLKGLLTYNPQDRLSAERALRLDCFAPLCEAEAAWMQTDRSVPFPVFFFEGPPIAPSPELQPPQEAEQAPEPALEPPPPPEPAFVPPTPEVVVLVHPKPTFQIPEPPKAPALLADPRARAAQRIKACHDAIRASKARKPITFHGAAFQFASSKQGLYQRPRPEIIQPRLPRVIL
jgi:renal tumor antigen